MNNLINPTIATLSGWGQVHDALKAIAPNAQHIDYASQPNLHAALNHIECEVNDAQTIIGWSLGGLLAAKLVAEKRLTPHHLVLIGVPFRFVDVDQSGIGMGNSTYETFKENHAQNAARTLKRAHALVAKDDAKSGEVMAKMREVNREDSATTADPSTKACPAEWRGRGRTDWHYWLEQLEQLDAHQWAFEHFPKTTIIHGRCDAVVGINQAHAYASRIEQATLHVLDEAGHAPHFHDPKTVLELANFSTLFEGREMDERSED